MTVKGVFFTSRERAESLAGDPAMVVISITDPGSPTARLHPKFHEVLRLSFYDAVPADEYLPAPTGLFNRDMAQRISQFVQAMHSSPLELMMMVHCEFGVSRSAAVALFVEALCGARLHAREYAYDANDWVLGRLQQLHPELNLEVQPFDSHLERRKTSRA